MPTLMYSLDNLVGGELWFLIHGVEHRFYAVFSANDVAHYERLVTRREADRQRQQAEFEALTAHDRATREAAADGLPPPPPLDSAAMGEQHPDYYAREEQERDVFNLLLSVWTKSEAAKPPHERLAVTPASVRDLSFEQAFALLSILFPRRGEMRVALLDRAQAPAAPAGPEAATSTVSTPNRQERRRQARSSAA